MRLGTTVRITRGNATLRRRDSDLHLLTICFYYLYIYISYELLLFFQEARLVLALEKLLCVGVNTV